MAELIEGNGKIIVGDDGNIQVKGDFLNLVVGTVLIEFAQHAFEYVKPRKIEDIGDMHTILRYIICKIHMDTDNKKALISTISEMYFDILEEKFKDE